MEFAMRFCIYISFLLIISSVVHAGCDPTQFRWGCSMNANVTEKAESDNLIYCGTTRLYVSKNQFEMIERYQRAGIDMHLVVNDIFYDGPCLPQTHDVDHRRPYRF